MADVLSFTRGGVPKRARILGKPVRKKGENWFRIALLALPTIMFTGILFAPSFDVAPAQASAVAAPVDQESATFSICVGRGRITCVVDGDTFWYQGTKIRIADIDTPEISRPACPREARRGAEATTRMLTLLNEGAFTLAPSPSGRTKDRYGRALFVVTREGRSLGDKLVSEGLADRWGAVPREWC